MSELDALRGELDEVDRQLVALFERRMGLTAQVGAYKIARNLPILDVTREASLLAEKRALLQNPDYADGVTALFETIMAISRQGQRRLYPGENGAPEHLLAETTRPPVADPRVLYQGQPGAYTEEAAALFFGENCRRDSRETWDSLFLALMGGEGDYGVLPIENSSSGVIDQVYDLLARHKAYLVGEQTVRVEHCLMAVPGATMDDVKTVYSHEQGLLQSRIFLETHQNWDCVPQLNTAESAHYVAQCGEKSKAAIGSARAAKLYGLDILAKPVNFNLQNATRFVVVSPVPEVRPGSDKMSVLLTLPHRSGSLYRLISVFAFHGLNLLKVESRPLLGRNWEYLFFVDFSGCLSNGSLGDVLTELREICSDLRILGCYPGEAAR